MTEVDWKALQTEAKAGSAPPDGDYDAIIVEASPTSSSNGKPMIKLKWRIFTPGPYEKRAISMNLTVSAESAVALRIFFDQMERLGLGPDFFAAGPKMDEVAAHLRNRGACLTLGTREWQGATLPDVKGIKALVLTGPPPPGLVTGPAVYRGTSTSVPSPMSTPTAPAAATPTGPTTPSTTIGATPTVGSGPVPPTGPPVPAF